MNKEIKMSKRLIVVSITAVMMLFATALSAQVEMMADGGFELQTATTFDGVMWYDDGGDVAVELGAGTARTGSNCAVITTVADWSGIGAPCELVPETEYTLSVWVKGDDIGATGTLGLWNDAAGAVATEIEDWNVNSTDWIELDTTFTTPYSTDATVVWELWLGTNATTTGGVIRVDDVSIMETAATGVEANGAMPTEYNLSQNYPNPFNPTTSMEFTMITAGAAKLVVYDILGSEVRTLVNAARNSGTHTVTWDGRDNAGNEVTSGMYFYRLTAGGNSWTRKMMFLK
jgi:hypothetical protein